jgi:hypothetical protein
MFVYSIYICDKSDKPNAIQAMAIDAFLKLFTMGGNVLPE